MTILIYVLLFFHRYLEQIIELYISERIFELQVKQVKEG